MPRKTVNRNPGYGISSGNAFAAETMLWDSIARTTGEIGKEASIAAFEQQAWEDVAKNPNDDLAYKNATNASRRRYNDVVKGEQYLTVVNQGVNTLNQIATQETTNGQLDSESYARYQANSAAAIEGILSATPEYIRPQVQMKLGALQQEMGLNVQKTTDQYNFNYRQANFKNNLSDSHTGMINAYASGNEALGNQLAAQMPLAITNAQKAGLIDEFDAKNMIKAAHVDREAALYSGRFRKALMAGRGSDFLYSFYSNRPKGMSEETHIEVSKALLQEKSTADRLRAEQQALNFAQAKEMAANGNLTKEQVDAMGGGISPQQRMDLKLGLDRQDLQTRIMEAEQYVKDKDLTPEEFDRYLAKNDIGGIAAATLKMALYKDTQAENFTNAVYQIQMGEVQSVQDVQRIVAEYEENEGAGSFINKGQMRELEGILAKTNAKKVEANKSLQVLASGDPFEVSKLTSKQVNSSFMDLVNQKGNDRINLDSAVGAGLGALNPQEMANRQNNGGQAAVYGPNNQNYSLSDMGQVALAAKRYPSVLGDTLGSFYNNGSPEQVKSAINTYSYLKDNGYMFMDKLPQSLSRDLDFASSLMKSGVSQELAMQKIAEHKQRTPQERAEIEKYASRAMPRVDDIDKHIKDSLDVDSVDYGMKNIWQDNFKAFYTISGGDAVLAAEKADESMSKFYGEDPISGRVVYYPATKAPTKFFESPSAIKQDFEGQMSSIGKDFLGSDFEFKDGSGYVDGEKVELMLEAVPGTSNPLQGRSNKWFVNYINGAGIPQRLLDHNMNAITYELKSYEERTNRPMPSEYNRMVISEKRPGESQAAYQARMRNAPSFWSSVSLPISGFAERERTQTEGLRQSKAELGLMIKQQWDEVMAEITNSMSRNTTSDIIIFDEVI